MKKPLESAVLANTEQHSFKTRLDSCKTDMCAVVDHLVAEFNTAISCPVNNRRCNRWVQHKIIQISRHHSTQGKVESEDLAQSSCWCPSIRIGMAHENNSSSICIAQLSSVNNAVHFAWFHKFSEPPPTANTWAHSRCRSTAWSLGAVRSKFSDFKPIPLNIHQRPTIFIAKAAIMLNDVGSVSRVNLLMKAASHWYRAFKNQMANQEPHCTCPEIKLIPRLMGSPRQRAPADLSCNES